MITTSVRAKNINEISRLLKGNQKKVRQQLKIAVNTTAKRTRGSIAKQIARELATPQKVIKKTSFVKREAQKTERNPTAIVTQSETGRIPLRDFRARQNKKGVTYKISKRRGRAFIPGAFQGPTPKRMKASWRGRVFKRNEKSRLPIRQRWGPSPWGVFQKKNMKKPIIVFAEAEMLKQVKRRKRAVVQQLKRKALKR